MTYDNTSLGHLKRAKQRLDDGLCENMLYCALELRLGIEARLRQYLEAQEYVTKKKRSGWTIKECKTNIEKVFKEANRKAVFIITDRRTGEEIVILEYTPVTKELLKYGERLSNILHSQGLQRINSLEYQKSTRELLELVYKHLEKANEGILLGPPMYNKKTGQTIFKLDPMNPKSNEVNIRSVIPISMRVYYPE